MGGTLITIIRFLTKRGLAMIPIGPKTNIGVIKRSGFANGLFGIGAYRVIYECLKYHKLKIKKAIAISSSSFSIMLESIEKFDEILHVWLKLTTKDIYEIPYVQALRHPLKRPSIFSSEPLRRYVTRFIKPHLDEIFSERALPFEIVTTDLDTGNAIYFSNQDIKNKPRAVDICMASAALIPFFPPVIIEKDGKEFLLADGAPSNDMPIKRLLDVGCELIFIIDVFGGELNFSTDRSSLAWPDLLTRATQISISQHSDLRLNLGEMMNSSSPAKFIPIWIKPEIPLEHINFRCFDQDIKDNLVEAGYWAAKVAVRKLHLDCNSI